MTELNIRGQLSPAATGSEFTTLRQLPAGETLTVTSDYPPARSTIPALAKQFGGSRTLRDLDDGWFLIEITTPDAPSR